MKKCFLLLFFSLILSQTSSAFTKVARLEWTGDGGYSVIAEFKYDSGLRIVGGSIDDVVGIEYLLVSVLDPTGGLVFRTFSIADFVSTYPYLSFRFDTWAGDFAVESLLDIGADPGYWLFRGFQGGSLGLNFSPDDPTVLPVNVDRGSSYYFTIRSVPEFGTSVVLFCLGISSLVFMRICIRKYTTFLK